MIFSSHQRRTHQKQHPCRSYCSGNFHFDFLSLVIQYPPDEKPFFPYWLGIYIGTNDAAADLIPAMQNFCRVMAIAQLPADFQAAIRVCRRHA